MRIPGFTSIVWLALSIVPATSSGLDSRLFVSCTDYTAGQLRRVDLAGPTVVPGAASVCADTRVRWHDGLVWVISRLNCDNLQVVDPATLTTVHQFSTGNGSNPYDVAFANGHVYVARYASPSILIMDPDTGANLGSISLAGFADADGIPEMDHMELVGPYLFVSCERLDENHNFQPTDYSVVAVVDTRADTVLDVDPALPGKQAIVLTGRNPVTPFAFDPATSRLLLGCVGQYGVLDGGFEWVDPVQMKSLGIAITESALGGEINAMAWYQATHSYAIVSDPVSYVTSLVPFNPTTGTRGPTIYDSGEFSLSDLALDDRGELWAANLSFAAPGLLAFRAGADTLVAGPIDLGLPPSQLAFDHETGRAGVVPAPIAALRLSAPRPNPARGTVRLTITAPRGAAIEAGIHDVAGRRVRRLEAGAGTGTPMALAWNLTNDAGAAVASGVYFLRVRAGGMQETRPIIVGR